MIDYFIFLVQKHALVGRPTKSSLGTMHPSFLQTYRNRLSFKSNSSAYLWESRDECKSERWSWIMLQKEGTFQFLSRILYFLVSLKCLQILLLRIHTIVMICKTTNGNWIFLRREKCLILMKIFRETSLHILKINVYVFCTFYRQNRSLISNVSYIYQNCIWIIIWSIIFSYFLTTFFRNN